MNLDIQTEHVAMRPEWHEMIDAWVDRCRRHHPTVVSVDLNLRHSDDRNKAAEVDAVAMARGRMLRATTRATLMTAALHDALDALERELLVHEALTRRPRMDDDVAQVR